MPLERSKTPAKSSCVVRLSDNGKLLSRRFSIRQSVERHVSAESPPSVHFRSRDRCNSCADRANCGLLAHRGTILVSTHQVCAELSIFQEDTKLDFKDVLIRPARSNLRSRSQVRMLSELVPSVPLITVHTGQPYPHLQIQVWHFRVDWSANHRCQHGASSVPP